MGFSVWQLAIVAIVILVLFGRGRISEMMGDFGKGISSFKKGMNEESSAKPDAAPAPSSRLEGPAHEAKPAGETAEAMTPPAEDKSA
ncbi:MAG: twin-arginine translocase TatA/TatE family subunit [Alteraurantiacibacter sp.]